MLAWEVPGVYFFVRGMVSHSLGVGHEPLLPRAVLVPIGLSRFLLVSQRAQHRPRVMVQVHTLFL